MTEEKQPTIDWGLIMGVITDTVKEIGVDGFLKGLRGLTNKQEPTHRQNTGRTETEDIMNHEERLQKLEEQMKAAKPEANTPSSPSSFTMRSRSPLTTASHDVAALFADIDVVDKQRKRVIDAAVNYVDCVKRFGAAYPESTLSYRELRDAVQEFI